MLYLSTPPPACRREAYWRARVGAIYTPNTGNSVPAMLNAPYWAADNGCYTAGDAFDLGRYYEWLDARAMLAGSCLFATAPDVPYDAAATWERSAPVLAEIRRRGYYVALVGQNGLEDHAPSWDESDRWDWLFLGGDDAWKDGPDAADCVREAQLRGKAVHVGRVNTRRRFRHAAELGADSADGTLIAYGPDFHLPRVADWLRQLDTRNGYAQPLALF